jgi:hypothetical protein
MSVPFVVVDREVAMMPDDLGETGIRLYELLTTGREFDPGAEVLIVNAARVADRLDELTQEIGGRLTVINDRGDEVANPLITEHRQQLAVFRAVCTTLGVGKMSSPKPAGKSLKDQLAEKRAERDARGA